MIKVGQLYQFDGLDDMAIIVKLPNEYDDNVLIYDIEDEEYTYGFMAKQFGQQGYWILIGDV